MSTRLSITSPISDEEIERQTPRRMRRASTSTSLSSSSVVTGRDTFISHLSNRGVSTQTTATPRPRVLGIHHLKFAVSNLDVSIAWYERVLGAQRIPELDHLRASGLRYAAICLMPDWGGLYLELRQAETRSQQARGWDPITLSVATRADLLSWIEWLDRWGTTHSPLEIGTRGWILTFEDPDGRHIRLFTRESHNGMTSPSTSD